MKFDPEIHHRRSIRLPGYDYSQPGSYFLTLCTFEKKCLFGQIVEGQMRLNEIGQMVHAEWFHTTQIRREIELDTFIVMPNHLHGIVRIIATPGVQPEARRGGRRPPGGGEGGERRSPLRMPARSVASFVAGFKSATTRRANELLGDRSHPLWQRNYYEHIVRNASELEKIREYIAANPLRWRFDRENPDREVDPEEIEWP